MVMTVHTADAALRARLDRVALGLSTEGALPGAEGDVFVDEEGTPYAQRSSTGIALVGTPRWPAPATVRVSGDAVLARGGRVPVEPLPAGVTVLLPSAGVRVDDARHAAWARAWSTGAAVLPIPWGPDEPADASAYVTAPLREVETTAMPAGAGVTVLLTGLSGSGKSTIARALVERLAATTDRTVTLLDGDVVRTHLSRGLGFSREDRDLNVRRIGWVAAEVTKHGGIAVCAPIAPYDETRRWVRAQVEAAGGPGSFVLVWVATPLAVCEARDVKGLYARARAGEVTGFTGIDDPYEVPTDADLVIDTDQVAVPAAVDALLSLLGLSSLTVT